MPQAAQANTTNPPTETARMLRAEIDNIVNRLIDLLDRMDGNPDDEDNGDTEPSLAGFGPGPGDDRELDTADDEPDHEDGHDRSVSEARFREISVAPVRRNAS